MPSDKLLTIAIPTYNRASLLDRQLGWVAQAIEGHEECCELILSDNASSDATADVIEKWRQTFEKTPLTVHTNRNPRNLGPIRNIAYCMKKATGKHVWTIGDDDAIALHTLRFVLESLKKHPGLALLILNFSSRHCISGELKCSRCFEIPEDRFADPGRPIVEWALKNPDPTRWGGLVLTTALVYRTDLAQSALAAWPEGLENLYMQFFVTAYCASRGATLLTRDTYLEMAEGRHFFTGNKQMLFRFKLAELPESLEKVATLGYSTELCRDKALLQRKKIKARTIRRQFLQKPWETLLLLKRHRRAMRNLVGRRTALDPL